MKTFLSFISILFISLPILAQKYVTGSNFPYIDPTPGEITLMACSPIPFDTEPTQQAFKDVVDCGFNLATSQGSVEYFKKVFSILGEIKLKYLISNPQFLKQDVRSLYIDTFKQDPHLGGWLLRDEPPYDIWQELSEQYKMFNREDSQHLIYINLVGILYKYFTGPAKSIMEYLESYQNLFTPSIFSYDYYPIINKNGTTTIEYDQFYSDLENFSFISKKMGRPFWSFCESIAYKTKSYSRPAPTEAYLKFQSFNALAYGAQGIVYWSYSLRKSNETEKYQSALVDMKGKKSKAWYAAQKVNKEIKKFNDIFYQCDVKEVRHTGDRIYKGTHKLSGVFGPFSMIRSGKAGVLVSRIENKGNKYIVIVNHDVFNKQNVTLEISSGGKIEDMTNNGVQYFGKNEITVSLEKAGWVIFKEIE